jgi:nucleoside 2-deoxyribosyltransferase/predicted secreted protein
MYVLCSPCILDPALRADGITKPSDLVLFERTIERCKKFGIEMVPLPCPETLYLGNDRIPGTFLERLDTQEFALMLDWCEEQVKKIIEDRGTPLCILGVNSSPTCGVTSTYYGSERDEPPKRKGRGVFLARFPDIWAEDVAEFAKFRIYLAAPLFSESEREYNNGIAEMFRQHLFEVYLPQDTGDDRAVRETSEHTRIYEHNKQVIHDSDIVIAIIDGADADSGTAWEMGYATALGKPVIALRTDFRNVGKHERVNLMLEQSSVVVGSKEELLQLLESRGTDLGERNN